MIGKLTCTVLFALFFFQGSGQKFVISDVLVSAPNARISDTEFDPYKNRMCWQSDYDNLLWICNLDTLTWMLTKPDGRETFIDSSLVPLDHTSNAGEWGFDQEGTHIVYNKLVNRWKYIAMATETEFNWQLTTFFDSPFRLNPHATKNPEDSTIGIHYFTGIWREGIKYKFMDDPCQEFAVHNFSDAHWADDEQLLTGILQNDQVGLFSPEHPSNPMQITFNTGTVYSRPYLWRAPEHGNSHMMFAVANGTEIQVFKEARDLSDHYEPYMSFPSPSSNPLLDKFASPEPVVFNGQSYLTFMTSSSPYETSLGIAEIWIVKLDSLNPIFRMISDTVPRVRTDPEPFATHDSLLAFYTEVVDSIASFTVYRVRKCRTGFGTGLMADAGKNLVSGPPKVKVFPNPFKSHIFIKNATGREHITLLNLIGRTIWDGTDISREDFSDLAAGVYFLRVRMENHTQTIKIIRD